MENSAGSNKTENSSQSSSSSGKTNSQTQNVTQVYSHADLGWKSSDNLCIQSQDGSKKPSKSHQEEGGNGSESESGKRGGTQSHRIPTSISVSPYIGGVSLSNCGTSCVYSNSNSYSETHSIAYESHQSCSMTAREHWLCQSVASKNSEGKSFSPTHITLSAPNENEENQPCSIQSNSPSLRASPRATNAHCSGESSDEREKVDRSKLSVSREGSFERSVSFQEGITEQEKSHEGIRPCDSNRSLDSTRNLEQCSQSSGSRDRDRDRKESREGKASEKDKKTKKPWYNVLSPTYKSRSEDLKRLFKDLPPDERLIVDYSCALQKDILVHGRLYVTPNYFSFYSKIFGWETFLSIKCKDIIGMTKEKTALVIPNALQVTTDSEKHFFTSFAARDKTYLMLFRIWQNALMDQLPLSKPSKMLRMFSNPNSPQISATELWHWVHSSYGEELGLTSDDDDYVAPSTEDDGKSSLSHVPACLSMDPGSDSASAKFTKRNSIDSTEDVSQGDSNVEDPQLTLKPSYSLEPSKSPFKSGKKGGGTSGAYHLSSSPGEDCNELPTDLSDTVESDQGKEKSSVSSKEVIVCPNIHSHHVGQEIANTVYGLPIDTLFTLLFTNSTFMLDLHTARKTYDVEASEWKSDSKNQKLRQVTYTLTLPTNSFGPKVSHVTETQVISSFSKPSEIYTIDSEAANGGIPYADYFYVSNHWCLTKESSTETRLTLYSQVQYKKDLWGFMKNLIDKHAFNGVKSLMSDLNTALLLEVDRLNLKRTKRRRRRAGSKGPDIADPLHQIIPPPGIKSNDIHKSTQIPSRKMTLPSVSAKTTEIPSVKGTVLLFLCLLLAVNAFLYYRLYDLEERVVSNVSFKPLGPDSPLFKLGDVVGDEGLTEEWVHILRQQESLHAEELERWKKAVMEAADHLRKAEESLRNLHASIPSQQASKMQALLQQLQLLQQMHEQKGAVPRERKPPDGSGAERNNEEAPSRPVNTDL